jgi:hypothetical protein
MAPGNLGGCRNREHIARPGYAGGGPVSYQYPPLAANEYRGVGTEGEICEKNGKPFSLPCSFADCRDYLAAGDVVGYRDSPRKYRITFVDQYTVQMVREGGAA